MQVPSLSQTYQSIAEIRKLSCPRKLSKEWIDPESDENLFKTDDQPDLWKDLCEFCQEGGWETMQIKCRSSEILLVA